MALKLDISRPLRSRADQQALVRAVFESPTDEQETHCLEWKGALTLVGRDATGRATIAKAVLGFANRDPDAASRVLGGCAYLVAGVSPGELPGVEAVDAAQLEAQVATYVGRAVDWRADYVVVDERAVLVVTVEPPHWGDPMHPVRKTFNRSDGRSPVLQEGSVFVRHQASTERATAADIDMLSRRAARRPGEQLEVGVRLAAETALRAIDVDAVAIERYIDRWRLRLLSPLVPGSGVLSPYGASTALRLAGFYKDAGEYRSEEQFREEVDGHLEELRVALPSVLRARAILHGMAHLKLEIVNNTDVTFTRVRIEAKLPFGLSVIGRQSKYREWAEPPVPPVAYGHGSRSRFGSGLALRSLASISPDLVGLWRPEIEQRADAVCVDYVPEDVRARGVTSLPGLWLLLDDPTTEGVEVHWEATATNAEKRVGGTLTVPIVRPPAEIEELLATLPGDEA